MGISSFTKFLRHKNTAILKFLCHLKSQYFFIDGHSLLYALSEDLDWRCGGELQTLRQRTLSFCKKFQNQEINIHVYIDGTKSNLKQPTLVLRSEKRLNALKEAFATGFEDIVHKHTVLPPTAMTVFLDTLLSQNVKIVAVQGEADGVLCYDSYQCGGIVCTNDSDCFIYPNHGVILLSDLLSSGITVPYYSQKQIVLALNDTFKVEWLPIFAVLCGNDYTRSFIDPVIKYIVSCYRYGYFMKKIAIFICKHRGDIASINNELQRVGVIDAKVAGIFKKCVNMYGNDGVCSVASAQINSMRENFLYTMFYPPVQAIISGKCKFPVVPYDKYTCTFDPWDKTLKLRKIIYHLLSLDLDCTIEEIPYGYFEPSRNVSYNLDAFKHIFETPKQTTRLDLLHVIVFGHSDGTISNAWQRKRKTTRILELACQYCAHCLKTKTVPKSWRKFENRLKKVFKSIDDPSPKMEKYSSRMNISLISQYYSLFQIVTLHLNLLIGIMDLYDRLPPLLNFSDGHALLPNACS